MLSLICFGLPLQVSATPIFDHPDDAASNAQTQPFNGAFDKYKPEDKRWHDMINPQESNTGIFESDDVAGAVSAYKEVHAQGDALAKEANRQNNKGVVDLSRVEKILTTMREKQMQLHQFIKQMVEDMLNAWSFTSEKDGNKK